MTGTNNTTSGFHVELINGIPVAIVGNGMFTENVTGMKNIGGTLKSLGNSLVDLKLMREVSEYIGSKQQGGRPPVAVDNTFLGPVFQRPLTTGTMTIARPWSSTGP